jgi:hypothetical protein
MSKLLELLKRIEFIDMRDDCGLINRQCPECGETTEHYEHHAEGCELKSQIDRLEAEEKIQAMYDTLSDNFNDQMRILSEKYRAAEILYERQMKAVAGLENTNEGHA